MCSRDARGYTLTCDHHRERRRRARNLREQGSIGNAKSVYTVHASIGVAHSAVDRITHPCRSGRMPVVAMRAAHPAVERLAVKLRVAASTK